MNNILPKKSVCQILGRACGPFNNSLNLENCSSLPEQVLGLSFYLRNNTPNHKSLQFVKYLNYTN